MEFQCHRRHWFNDRPAYSLSRSSRSRKTNFLTTIDPVVKMGSLFSRWVCPVLFFSFIASFAPIAYAKGQSSYPTTAEEATAHFEGQVDEWLSGPVDYIILDDERKQWDTLETTDQRRAFINWFWARRDVDLRDSGNPFKIDFYQRVATANQRFRGFPRGWKSDQGLVWVIIGRPDAIGRRTSAQLFDRFGPDFNSWTYHTTTRNLGFTSRMGEVVLLFIESRPGDFRIYDLDFGEGIHPIWLQQAFEYARESVVVNPHLEFNPTSTDTGYVMSASGSTLTLDVPLESWHAQGAEGLVLLPVRVGLEQLLFTENDNGGLLAELQVQAMLTPEEGQDPLFTREQWSVNLSKEQLAEHGSGSLLGVLAMAASVGTYDVHIGLSNPLTGSSGLWEGRVEVGPANIPSGTSAVGKLSLPLDKSNPSVVGLLSQPEPSFSSGDLITVHAWLPGADLEKDRLWLIVTNDNGMEQQLQIRSARWLGSLAGPLTIEAVLPELPKGDLQLRLVLSSGANIRSVTLKVNG
ncbi:MAG: hypothetical protein CL879_13310 [Dehalococcoidia bacterium]|nr:hypothetical protein [Dehalococcoidia bacterium]